MLTETQINQIASEINITDIYDYVKDHLKEYQDFLNVEKNKKNNKVEDNYEKIINDIIVSGKLEVPI